MNYGHFRNRRERLFSQMEDGIAIIPAASVVHKNNSNEYPFIQYPNFYYLSGFYEPEAVLVMKKDAHSCKTIIFTQPRNPKSEQWTGLRLGPDRAAATLLVDEAYSIEEFDKMLPSLLKGHPTLYMELFGDHPIIQKVFQRCRSFGSMRGKDSILPQTVTNLTYLVAQMRLVKDEDEIDAIRKAVEISAEAYRSVMHYAKPGINERQVQGMLEFMFRQDPCSEPSYIPIIASGNNATILHYVNNDRPLVDGELLLIDAGSQYQAWACDITRTFPVNGKFSSQQKDIYEIVLASLNKGISSSAPGETLEEIDKICKDVLLEGLISLGILSGTFDEHVEKKSVGRFCPYAISHWLGLGVHEQCATYTSDGILRPLGPGMVFTIEPGLYLPKEWTDIPDHFKGIGVRLEDDIVITAEGGENLSAAIPVKVADVEACCR